MQYAPFDLVMVPFPYVERAASYPRPAMVVSGINVKPNLNLYWLMMITAQENQAWFTDIPIDKTAKLPIPSVLRLSKIVTAEEDMILHKVGILPLVQQSTVHDAFLKISFSIMERL